MAVWAEQTQILQAMIVADPIDMVQLEREFQPSPVCDSAFEAGRSQ